MRVCLAQGRAAPARAARELPPLPPNCAMADSIAESDPATWPQYVLDWDDDGSPHIVDIDCCIEWDGWRIPEFDSSEGGES
jgi:hypothetical protein